MDEERNPAASDRLTSLAGKFHDKRYRDGYVAANTRSVLARQMRNFRGEHSQAEFGAEIEKRQTVISRLENPAYGGWSLRTMLEIARKKNVAVFVRFVDFPTFLRYSGDISDCALHPNEYDENEVDQFARKETAAELLSSFATWPSSGIIESVKQQYKQWEISFEVSSDPQMANPAWRYITVNSGDDQRITVQTINESPSSDVVAANANGSYTVTGKAANV